MSGPEYDVIVVGAGSAGAALAGRLTEDDGRRVLVLEAGPDYRSADAVPEIRSIEPMIVMPTATLLKTHMYAELLAARTPAQDRLPYARGRGVGGSSAVNGLFAIRATVEDFDGWAAQGCAGWGHDDVLPLLRRLENDLDFGAEAYHGGDGPIPITRPRHENFAAVDAAVDAAARRLGHPWAPDHNAPGSTGVSPYALNSFGTVRVSTNDAYLEPARDRPGLRVVGDALVDRVLFDGNRVTGVRAIVAGEPVEFRAAEVVVSAGAIHSPAVLLRSGVGPAGELRDAGIGPVMDLPVGRGLQDHPSIALGLGLHQEIDYRGVPMRGQICVRFTTGVGDEVNDAMIAVTGALGLGVPAAGVVGWVNRVASTGSVRLASTDPSADPLVDFDLLSHPDDLRRFRAVTEELRSFAAQPELRSIASAMSLSGLGSVSADPAETMSDDEFARFALAAVSDTVHASGSCRMGAPDDPRAVVDPHGRVLGVDGLRVADASILPWVPRANTNLTAILVGEKVAASMREGSTL
ncbi:GMC family oxidoreductase [Jiangella sp. DSM 45060]|uniref:GMC family oxidoreductase n=1 Tax=Jiangella sp. DSM 45060 TaxID=1798224 RepID=UPI00087AD4E2|nr:GMC family oxidoreductase N-terminal domain-containing protein [Jiangella sp. DSM 45060]SDT15604.1 choline dehydrogenase [Jiangella sp. DSM 45060]